MGRRSRRRRAKKTFTILALGILLLTIFLLWGWLKAATVAAGLAFWSGGESYRTRHNFQMDSHMRWRMGTLPITRGQLGIIMMIVGAIMILAAIVAIAAKI